MSTVPLPLESKRCTTGALLVRSVQGMELHSARETEEPNLHSEMAKPSHTLLDEIKELFGLGPKSHQPHLHNPTSMDTFISELQKPGADPNAFNVEGDGPIHALVKRKSAGKSGRRLKQNYLVSLLTYSDAFVDHPNESGMTALHLAAQGGDFHSVKTLVAFAADVNPVTEGKTPLDLLENRSQSMLLKRSTTLTMLDLQSPQDHADNHMHNGVSRPIIIEQAKSRSVAHLNERVRIIKFLKAAGAVRGSHLWRTHKSAQPCFLDASLSQKEEKESAEILQKRQTVCKDWAVKLSSCYFNLEAKIELRLNDLTRQLVTKPDEALSLAVQLRELRMFKQAGSRILFLDGGGMRGLLQIEILSQLERKTGRSITELFDWIVGTSTGGMIALGLVHAKMTLRQLRQSYFEIKEPVFGKNRAGMAFNSEEWERWLKEKFGDLKMCDVTYPRVIVPAVCKKSINLKLHFFNNCFDDEYSTQLCWKVARYTTAAPMFFTELDCYVDGGVLANNPCESGLTKIQEFFYEQKRKLPISLILSVGAGKLPEDELGKTDAQEFLFFGKHWFDFSEHIGTRAANLTTLLGNAIAEAEMVSRNCAIRAKTQGIPYYRISPQLSEVVPSGETDTEKLIDMIAQGTEQVPSSGEFTELALRLHKCALANQKMSLL